MTKYSVVILFFVLLTSSCKKNIGAIDEENYRVIVDSVDQWINIAKNSNTSKEHRDLQLAKASMAIHTLSVDSLKAKYLSELSLYYYQKKDTSNFFRANKELEAFAIKIKDSIRLAESYWDKGAYFDSPSIEDRDSAYYYFSKGQKLYELLGEDLESARLLNHMATVQTAIHDDTGALVTTTKALELLLPLEENIHIYAVYNVMGNAANGLEEYDQALKYYEKARQYLTKTKSGSTSYASLENNIGVVQYAQGNYKKAKQVYEKAISYDSVYMLRPSLYAKLLDHIAITDLKLGEMATVENKLMRALGIRDSIGDREGLSLNFYNLAEYYKAVGNKADAYIYARSARDLAKEIDNNNRYMESLKLMAELDPDMANSYNKEYIRVSDSLQQEERKIRNKFDRIRFETEETEAENIALARQRLLWIGIAAGVLLFAIALWIIVLQRAKNQRLKFQQQQQEANQEIFNLMLAQKQKLEEGKQTEQKRISEELHDGVLGEMNGVRMILLGLNKKEDKSAIALREQAIEKLKEVQEEIRAISHELSDASYQRFNNFMNSIQDLLKSVCEPANIKCHLSFDQDMDWDNLEGITKINIYRIVQESLQNSIKHAKASSVYISFDTNEDHMMVSIQDDGIGFDTGKGKKGIGHRNIKSRIEKLKGRWYLRSAPGIGTTVVLEIPLEHISLDEKKEISLTNELQEV